MAIDFPPSPTLNQEYTFGSRTWIWNGSGWETKPLTIQPGGSNTQVLFNDVGTIGGDAQFTYNKTTDTLSISTLDISGAYNQTVISVPALNIDCGLGNYFIKTISADSTFTVSNVPASRVYAFTLELTHTSGAVTWFTGVQWPKGTPPALTTGKTHLFVFITDDGGTRWRGASQIDYTN